MRDEIEIVEEYKRLQRTLALYKADLAKEISNPCYLGVYGSEPNGINLFKAIREINLQLAVYEFILETDYNGE